VLVYQMSVLVYQMSIAGRWEKSVDRSSWEHDFNLLYPKVD